MSFFDYLSNPEYAGTIWLYNFIFAITTLFAFLAQRGTKINSESGRIKKFWFILSFLTAWFFFTFNNTGADLKQYIAQYEESSFTLDFITQKGLESGYRTLIAFFHLFVKNSYVGIGVLKTIQISIIFACIYKLRNKISVGYAVMTYMALFYFASFNVFRISLAGSLVLASYILLINKKWAKAAVLISVAYTIHNSVLVFALAYAFYLCYMIFKKDRSFLRYIILFAVPVIVFLGRNIIISFLKLGMFANRYTDYVSAESSFGIMQILFYLPLFYVLYRWKRENRDANNDDFDINYIFSLSGFAVAMVGYSVGILSRVSIFFAGPFIFYIPQYLKQRSRKSSLPLDIPVISVFMFIYWIIRYMLSIGGYFITSGLYPFKFVF